MKPGNSEFTKYTVHTLELGTCGLFGDCGTLKARISRQTYSAKNFFPKSPGNIDIIFIDSFLHLVTWDQKKIIAAQLVSLLRSREISFVLEHYLATTEEDSTLAANACG